MFKIQEQAGVPSKQQKLIFAGKQLEGGVYEEPHVQVSPDTLHHQVAASATGGPRIVVHSRVKISTRHNCGASQQLCVRMAGQPQVGAAACDAHAADRPPR